MNILAKRSFPEFYQSYAPKLLEFYSAWLDWTDLKGNSQYIINHLSTEHDIDESIDAYRTHLKDKYLNDFPEQMVIDLKLLLKNVLYLYRAKSSKKAYDFLFRVLFDSPAKLWYPRENILKTSDGRWYIPCYISINPVTDKEGNAIYEQFNNEILTDAFGNTIDNAYLLENCHYYRITGDISKSISYIEQATNFSGSVKTRDGNSKINENKDSSDNYNVILSDLAELDDGNYQYGQSAISITSSTGWFYPGETITITNVDTGEELPYHPVVQWYVETAGHYTSTKGFLSDINRIQDNHFYQNYSYVIQSYVGIRYWRDIVKKLLHPAGLGFFGEVLLSGDLEDGDGVYYYKDIDDRPKDTFDDNEDMQEYFKEHPEYKDSFNGKDQCEPYIDYIRKFYVFFRHLLEYSNNILDYCFDSNGNHIYVEDSAEYKELYPYETYYNFELLYGENKIECIINSNKTTATINVVEYTEKKNKVKYSKTVSINKNNLFIINHLPYIFKTEEDGLKIVNGVNGNKYEITNDKFTINNVEYEIIRYNNGNVKHIKCGDDIYEAYDSFYIDNIYETGYCAINSTFTNYTHKFSSVNRPITGTIKKYPSDETKNKARCCYKIYDKRDDNGNIEYDENGNKIKVCYQYYEPSVVYKPSYSYSINLLDYVYDENGQIVYDENGKPKTKIGNGINFRRNTLAQTRSIITDIWLFNEYLAKQYPDVSEKDLTPYVNKNSVLLFRDLGTLIDPDIIDWAYVGFKKDIDKPFMYNGEIIDNYKTKNIYGVTLRPQYDVIIDTIDSNEYIFKEDDDFIPDNYLVFISSSHEANTSRVGTMTVKNEYLNYHNSTKVTDITENSFTLLGATFNINYDEDENITSISNDLQEFNVYDNKFKVGNNDDTVEYFIDLKKNCVSKLTYYDAESYNAYMDKLVKDTILNDRAKRYLKNATTADNTETDETDSRNITVTYTIIVDEYNQPIVKDDEHTYPVVNNNFSIDGVAYTITTDEDDYPIVTDGTNVYDIEPVDGKRQFTISYTSNEDDLRTVITRWGSLITNDFIYISADSNRVFNEYSMVKIPDEYVTVEPNTPTEENPSPGKYVFSKNAYIDENIRIFNYADNDFSYKVWIERNNYDVTIKLTFFGNSVPRILPREYEYTSSYNWRNYWKKFIKNQNLEPVSYNVVEGTNKTTIEYKFETPVDKQPAKFEIEFPEYIENERMMLFTNGLFVPKVTTTGNMKTSITINTVENNNVNYQTDEIPFGDLTYVSNVFISENSTMELGEMTLPDLMLLERNLTNLYDVDLRDNATNIKSTTISTQTSYAELYVLSQIEAAGSPRILKYPYNADLQKIYPEKYVALTDGTDEYSVATDNTFIIGNKTYSISSSIIPIKDENDNIISYNITTYVTDGIDRYEVTGNQFTLGEGANAVTYRYVVKSDILKRYMFTYDNLRMMPFASHSFSVTKHADVEIAPDKESLAPSAYSHISWFEIFNKEIKMTYHNVIGRTNDVQDHSELLDVILDRFEYYRMMPKVNTNDVTLAQSIQEFIDIFSDDVHFRRGLNQINTGTIREFVKNYDILCTTNYSSTLVFDENGTKITATNLMDDTISTDNHIDWARKEISSNWVNEENPIIQKLYSVPLNATKVAEGFYQKSNVVHSCPEYYKSKNTFIFVNGLKILDSDIEYDDANYTYTINEKYFRDGRKKRIEVYNFGDNFLLSLGNQSGYISFEDTNHDWGVNMHPGLEVTVTVVEEES